MKLTNIGYVAKLNKQKTKKGRERVWRGAARGNGKSTITPERDLNRILGENTTR